MIRNDQEPLHPHRQLDAAADNQGSDRVREEPVEDSMMARHYGLTDDEFDFIPSTMLRAGINHDIKYRMGGEAGEAEE
jgi:hypothetical protein